MVYYIYICLERILNQDSISIGVIIKNVLTTDINNKYTGILWFLQNLISLYLIYPILKYLYDNNKQLYNYLFIILIISTIGINFANMIIEIITKFCKVETLKLVTGYINKFNILSNKDFLLFFMFGGYLYEKKNYFESNKHKFKFITIGIIAWICSFIYTYMMSKSNNKTYSRSFNYNSIFCVFIIIGFFATTNFYNDKGHWYNKIITSIGKNSLGIYLIHKIIIDFLNAYVPVFNTISILRCVKVIIVLIISWIITITLTKIPKLKELVKL